MTTTIHAAFLAAYSEIENPKKDATNPAFRSQYATLEEVLAQVKPVLLKHGLALVQTVDGNELSTYLIDGEGVQMVIGRYPLEPDKQTPQGMGSAITYARRYALKGVFGLAEVDDDGNAASKPQPRTVTATKTKPQPDSTGWDAIVDGMETYVTKKLVYAAIEKKYGKEPKSDSDAKRAWAAMSKAEQASLALIAVGATVEEGK